MKVRFGYWEGQVASGTYEVKFTITEVYKKVGDSVKAGEPIYEAEIEAGKATFDIEAPVSGIIVSLTDPVDKDLGGEEWKEGDEWQETGKEETPRGVLCLPALGEIETKEAT